MFSTMYVCTILAHDWVEHNFGANSVFFGGGGYHMIKKSINMKYENISPVSSNPLEFYKHHDFFGVPCVIESQLSVPLDFKAKSVYFQNLLFFLPFFTLCFVPCFIFPA